MRATGTNNQDATADTRHSVNLVARLVARIVGNTCNSVTTVDETDAPQTIPLSDVTANENTPVLQGCDADCGPVMIAENKKPPFGLEPKTYALRKHRSTN